MRNIAELLYEQELLKSRISKMIYGSIEIREKNEKKYIYVHFRDEGILISKYAGEYSLELYNLILENNKIVKEYKKQLKEIKKELGLLSRFFFYALWLCFAYICICFKQYGACGWSLIGARL